ncbi:tonsoku-like protein [Ciona intestinalis]
MNSKLKEIKKFQRLRQKSQESNNLKEEAEVCNVLGNLYLETGDTTEALSMHQNELALCGLLHDVVGQAVAHRKIGDVFVSMSNYTSAIKHHTLHLELASRVEDKVEMQRANTSLGRTYLDKSSLPSTGDAEIEGLLGRSIKLFNESLRLVGEVKVGTREFVEMKVRSFINLGLAHHQLNINNHNINDATRSVGCFEKALSLAETHNNTDDLYLTNQVLVGVNIELSKHSVALKHAEAMLKVAKQTKKLENIDSSSELCAESHLQLGNIHSAKDYLKRIYLKTKQNSLRDETEAKLKTVIKMCRISHEVTAEETSVNRKYSLHEAIADLFCKLRCFEPALKHYKAQESTLDDIEGITNKQRKSVYFSIASTLVDLKRYNEAIEYFNDEMNVTSDSTDHVDIYINISRCLEGMGKSYREVKGVCTKSIKCAEDCGSDHLKMKALVRREEIETKFDDVEAADVTKGEISMLELKVGEIDEGSETMTDCYNSCPLDDSMELLEEELAIPLKDDEATRRSKRALVSKQNCLGETGLHQACIGGDLKRVQLLIKQGHQVNPRDFCGWTPLHEASNHGHEDIVEYLLQHGAHINDLGGEGCGNLTPINDAANNGHFNVVEILLNHNANPFIANNEGLNVLATLRKYRGKYGDEMDEEQRSLCDAVCRRLDERKDHHPVVDLPIIIRDARIDVSSSPPNIDDVISDDVITGDVADNDITDNVTACDVTTRDVITEYRSSITSMGSSRRRKTFPVHHKRSVPALVERSAVDPWLVDDVDPPRKKRRFLDGGSWDVGKRTKITDYCSEVPRSQDVVNVEDRVPDEDIRHDVLDQGRVPTSSMRVKVEIEDFSFFVAVPPDKPMSWLNEVAASCYERNHRVSPTIQLSCDDVLMMNEDLVSVVLRNNDVIKGVVMSWNIQPLSERYVKYCQQTNIVEIPRITNACKDCAISKSLEIKSLRFPQHLKPLFLNLRKQEITKINFSGCRIGWEGVKCLCENVRQPLNSSLTHVNMSCTAMNDHAMIILSQASSFHNLTHLNTSFNPLCAVDGLLGLLSACPNLRELNVQCCQLRVVGRQHMFDAGLPNLEVLNISQNNFGTTGLKHWLKLIHRNHIKSLNVRGVSDMNNNKDMARILRDFLETSNKKLNFLDLSENQLDDDVIRSFDSFVEETTGGFPSFIMTHKRCHCRETMKFQP